MLFSQKANSRYCTALRAVMPTVGIVRAIDDKFKHFIGVLLLLLQIYKKAGLLPSKYSLQNSLQCVKGVLRSLQDGLQALATISQ